MKHFLIYFSRIQVHCKQQQIKLWYAPKTEQCFLIYILHFCLCLAQAYCSNELAFSLLDNQWVKNFSERRKTPTNQPTNQPNKQEPSIEKNLLKTAIHNFIRKYNVLYAFPPACKHEHLSPASWIFYMYLCTLYRRLIQSALWLAEPAPRIKLFQISQLKVIEIVWYYLILYFIL